MTIENKGDLVVARPQALVVRGQPQIMNAIAASDLLTNSMGATILVVTGERGGVGVDTLVACIVALCDGADKAVHVVEVGTSRGYLKPSLRPDEYTFVSVADPDFVSNLITALAQAQAGQPVVLSVNAAAWKEFVHIEEELRPWIDQAPERYCVLMKLGPRDETSRAEEHYQRRGGLGRVIRCFTEPPLGLRAAGTQGQLRHDPEGRILQVPRLNERLQAAFYDHGARLSSAMAGATFGEAALFARAMRVFATGLEDVL